MTPAAEQLPLGVTLAAGARFDNFVAGPNDEAVGALRAGAEPVLYLWGPAGLGKTHLLQAACREAAGPAAYLPLGQLRGRDPSALEGLESLTLVCVDDLEAVAGARAWEEALFHLFNRLRDAGARLAVAAAVSPEALPLALADLRSRLAWGPVYGLRPLDDDQRLRVLAARARARGLELPEETGRYLLRRCPRDLATLCALLDHLDVASLAAQRRLTVPFVREVLAEGRAGAGDKQ